MCVHWYDVKAEDFKTYVTKWHDTYNKDIFITEFAPQVGVHTDLSWNKNVTLGALELQRRCSAYHR